MGDDDQFRHYLPLVRRIIILVAVLTAVPVILWTITAFVRTYVGPPKVPTFRPMAAAATMDVPGAADAGVKPEPTAQQTVVPVSPPPVVEARATATDARGPLPAPKGPLLADRSADGDAGLPAGGRTGPAAALPPINAVPQAVPMPTAADVTGSAASNPGATAMQQQSDAAAPQADADALPASEPLAGPIPLPRHRPRYFAMAQVPMPRARPDAAGPSASDTSPGPLDWLQKLFKPPQQ